MEILYVVVVTTILILPLVGVVLVYINQKNQIKHQSKVNTLVIKCLEEHNDILYKITDWNPTSIKNIINTLKNDGNPNTKV